MFPRPQVSRFTHHFTDYEDQTATPAGSEFVIPSEFTALDDASLAALHSEAVQHFDTLYGDGQSLTPDDVETLSALTTGIEAIAAELAVRQESEAQRSAAAADGSQRAG